MSNPTKEDKNNNQGKTSKQDNSKEIKDPEKSEGPSETEILNDLPPEIREVVRTGISMQRISGPMPNPLLSKINESHIDKILDLADKEDMNSFKDAQSSRRFNLLYFLILIGLFVFITLYLAKDDKELFTDILKIIISIAGGFGGGYGYKSYVDSKKKE